MKLAGIAVAGALVLAGAVPGLVAPAAAQRTVVTERTVVHDRPVRRGWHSRKACRMEWRNHHRVRICRTVRYR